MKWYATLTDTKNLRLRDYLNAVRGAELSMEDEGEQYESEGRFQFVCLLIYTYIYLLDIAYQPEHLPEINEEDVPRRKSLI